MPVMHSSHEYAYQDGFSSFRAGVPLEKCPPFCVSVLSESWKKGWEAAELEKKSGDIASRFAEFKGFLEHHFPVTMKYFELKLKDEYR